MEITLIFLKIFAEIIINFWYIFLTIGILIALRIFIDKKTAKRNSKIEYKNQKQAYKDAIRELEKESK